MRPRTSFLTLDRAFLASIVLASIVALFPAVPKAVAQNSKGNWLVGPQADQFWEQMAESPYAQNGDHGMMIYMISYSSCSNCIAFLRDFWEQHKANMQLREVFAPVLQPKLLNEAADMALTRNPAFADAYYHQRRVAPPVNSAPERQAALTRVEQFTTSANQFFRKIGHIQDGFPTFIFRVRDEQGRNKLWIISGWGPDLAQDMDKWVRENANSATNVPTLESPQLALQKGAGR